MTEQYILGSGPERLFPSCNRPARSRPDRAEFSKGGFRSESGPGDCKVKHHLAPPGRRGQGGCQSWVAKAYHSREFEGSSPDIYHVRISYRRWHREWEESCTRHYYKSYEVGVWE